MELGANASTFTGGITVNSGVLQLDGVGSSGGAGNPITVNSEPLALGVIGIGYNVANQAALNITAGSSGVLGINGYGIVIANQGVATPFTANINLATLGNGSMYFGSESTYGQTLNATYGGTTLGVGNGGTYRLGGGGGQLTITNNVLTASTNLVIGKVGGILELPLNGNVEAPYGYLNAQGAVKFTVPQTNFNGSVTVNGGLFDQNGTAGVVSGVLELPVPATSGQAIGTGTTNVTLNGGMLQLDAPSTANTGVTMGTLTANGGPAQLSAGTTSTGTKITFANFVRNNNSAMFVGFGNNNFQQADTVLGLTGTQFYVANSSGNSATAIGNFAPNAGTNGMVTYGGNVAPWIMYSNPHTGGELLAYGANGFTPTIYTLNGTANGFVDGVGTPLASALSTDIVQFKVGGTSSQITDASIGTSGLTVYALSVFFGTGQRNPTIDSTGGGTLTITSGALTQDIQNGGVTIGSNSAASALNVTFGAEAVLYEGYYNGQGNFNLLNLVTAPSLSQVGPGSVSLDNASANSGSPNLISGPVTIDSGTIITGQNGANEYSLGSGAGSNVVVLNGGTWLVLGNTGGSGSITHNISVGPAGGIFDFGSSSTGFSGSYSGSISDLVSPDGTAAGPLTLVGSSNGNSTMTLTNTTASTNLWSGGTIVTGGGTIVVQSGVNFGVGPVEVSAGHLTLQGSGPNTPAAGLGTGSNLNPTVNLTVDSGATANFQGAAPIVGSLDGAGLVVLGNTTAATNTPIGPTLLTLGGNNASTNFYGVISDKSATDNGSLTKVGTGTFTLSGINTYTGPTAVNAGTLRVNGSLRGTGAVSVGGPTATGAPILSGSGTIAGPVTIFGTNDTTIGAINGSSGSTLTLTGGLTLNNGSISNFALTTAGANNLTALIATSITSGNSLTVDTGNSGVNTVNLSGTAQVNSTYDLYSFTGTGPAASNFTIGSNTISTPNLSYNIQVIGNQVDLVITSATTISWVGAGTSGSGGNWDIGSTQDWASSVPAANAYSEGSNVVFNDTNALDSNNTFTSPQTVNITAANVNPGSVMFNNNSVPYTIAGGAISGATGLTLNGTAGVTLTSANSFTGPVAVNAGALNLQNSALGSGSSHSSGVAVASGAALQLQGGISIAAIPLSLNGTGLAASPAGALQSVSGNNAYAGAINLGSSGATVTSSTLGNTLTLTGGVNTAGNLLTINGAGDTTVSTAGITGGGGVTYAGTGTLALSAVNGYIGPTTVDSGTLRLTGSLNAGSAVTIGGTSPAASGSPTLTGNGTINGSLTVFGGGSGNVAGHVAPSGFTGSSGTTLNLGSALTFNTGSDLDFNLNSNTSSGNDSISVTGSGAVNYGTGGVLNINAYNTNLAAGVYTLVNDTSSTTATGGTGWTVGTSNDPNRPAALGGNGLESYTIGLVGNNLDLTITNTAIFWAGATTSWDTTSTSNWVTSTGQTLKYFNGIAVQFGDTHPPGSTPVGTTSVAIQSAGVTPLSVTFTNATSNYSVSTSGSVGIGGSTGVALNGPGTVTFTSPNTFTGPVAINDGQLNLQNSNAVASSSGVTVASGAALQLQGGVSIGSVPLSISGAGLTASPAGALQSVSGANSDAGAIGIGSGGATIASSNSGNTLTLTGGITNNGNLVTFSGAGNAAVNSAINGLGGLTYAGAGTLTLSTTNGYSGATTVNSGTLRLTGSLAAASTVTVGGTTASGASGSPTLSGGGTVNGSLVAFAGGAGNVAGHLAPSGFTGSSATALNVGGDLTLNGGSELDFNLSNNPDGPGFSVPTGPNGFNDHINVAGTLSLNGGGELFINDPSGLSVGTYELVDYGNLSGSAAGWQVGGTPPSQFNYAFTTVNAGQFDLVVTTASGSGKWTSNGNQLYNIGTNWDSGTAPDGVGQSATFGTGQQTVVKVNGAFTVGSLNFTSASMYTLESLATSDGLTLNNGVGNDAQVNVADGGAMGFLYTQVNLASSTGNTNFTIQPGSSLVASAFNIDSTQVGLAGSNQGITLAGGGTLELAATNTYTGPTHVNSGTLLIDAGASIASTSITVGMGATLQLAGTTHALPSTANIKTSGSGAANDGAIVLAGGTTESIGAITSDPTTNVNGAQVYAGNTTVGDGAIAASLTATQIDMAERPFLARRFGVDVDDRGVAPLPERTEAELRA